MKNVIIRNINKEDIPKVVDIQVTGWQTAYEGIIDDIFLSSMSREERIKKREKDYQKDGFIVALLNNEIVGFARYIDNNSYSPEVEDADCELCSLYVKSDLKYNGIGTKLFEYVKDEFLKNNKKKMVLWCLKDNKPSIKFYEKMGGKVINERMVQLGEKDYPELCFGYEINR